MKNILILILLLISSYSFCQTTLTEDDFVYKDGTISSIKNTRINLLNSNYGLVKCLFNLRIKENTSYQNLQDLNIGFIEEISNAANLRTLERLKSLAYYYPRMINVIKGSSKWIVTLEFSGTKHNAKLKNISTIYHFSDEKKIIWEQELSRELTD